MFFCVAEAFELGRFFVPRDEARNQEKLTKKMNGKEDGRKKKKKRGSKLS